MSMRAWGLGPVIYSLLAVAGLGPVSAAEPEAKGPSSLRVYYFGNSLTENTMPPFHPLLAQGAGKRWETASLIAGGAPLFHLADQLDQDQWSYGARAKTRLLGQPWDAITLQPATWIGLRRTGAETGGWVKDPTKEVGDLASASRIIDTFLGVNPRGKVFIFSPWPGMSGGQQGPGGQMQMSPAERASFDYPAAWLKKYDAAARWQGNTFSTRDYHSQLFEALKEKYPKLWTSGRLAMIPSGDVYLALDEKLKAAKLPGITGIASFYTDVIHQRSGLPRYTSAAIFYATMFQSDPAKLDWRAYANPELYKRTNDNPDATRRFFVNLKDLGEHLPMTAENVKLVNDVIWEVVRAHPYAGLKP